MAVLPRIPCRRLRPAGDQRTPSGHAFARRDKDHNATLRTIYRTFGDVRTTNSTPLQLLTSSICARCFRRGRPVLAAQECSGLPEIDRTDLRKLRELLGGETRLTLPAPNFGNSAESS